MTPADPSGSARGRRSFSGATTQLPPQGLSRSNAAKVVGAGDRMKGAAGDLERPNGSPGIVSLLRIRGIPARITRPVAAAAAIGRIDAVRRILEADSHRPMNAVGRDERLGLSEARRDAGAPRIPQIAVAIRRVVLDLRPMRAVARHARLARQKLPCAFGRRCEIQRGRASSRPKLRPASNGYPTGQRLTKSSPAALR